MTLDDFAKSWLKAQGVYIYPCPEPESRVVGNREGEFVPRTLQYERSDY